MPDKNEDTPEGGGIDVVWTSTILILLFSPITALAAALTYYASASHKIRVAGVFQAVLAPLLILLGVFFFPAYNLLITAFTKTLPGFWAEGGPHWENYVLFILQQSPFAIPLGVTVGMIYCLQKWRNQPKWQRTELRRTPLEVLKTRRVIKEIEQDRNSPKDGMTLGIDERGNRIVQTWDEAAKHTLVFGTVGSGKTTELISRLRDSTKAGHGAIIIDLKGGVDFPEAAYELATRYGRNFQHWTMVSAGETYSGPSPLGAAYYDPIARGDATRRTNLIIGMKDWSDDHYRLQSTSFLQLAFSIMIANPDKTKPPLADIVSLLDPHALHQRSIPLAGNPEYADIVQVANKLVDTNQGKASKNETAADLHSILNNILLGTGGRYLLADPDKSRNNNINLFNAAHSGDIVVFSLDSSNYPEMASVLANLIVQDLKTVSSELRRAPLEKPFEVIIDEFASIGSDNIIGFANKSRDAKMPVTLATQTLGDLKVKNANNLSQLAGLVASFIVMRSNTYDDVEFFAGLTGKVEKKRVNESVHMADGMVDGSSGAGRGSVQSFEDFVISPTEIQDLKTGELIYIHRPSQKILRVQCIKEKLTPKQEAEFAEELEARAARENERLRFSQEQQGVTFEAPPEGPNLTPTMSGAPVGKKPDFSALFSEDSTSGSRKVVEAVDSLPPRPKDMPDHTTNLDSMARIMGRSKEEAEALLGARKSNISVSPVPPSPATRLPVVNKSTPLPAKLPTLPSIPKLPAAPALPPRPPATPKPQVKPSLPITEGEPKDEFDF